MDPLNMTDDETIAALEALAKAADEEYRVALRGLSCAKAAEQTAPPGFSDYSDQHERALNAAKAEVQTHAGQLAALNRAIDSMKAIRDLVPAAHSLLDHVDGLAPYGGPGRPKCWCVEGDSCAACLTREALVRPGSVLR